MKKHLSLIVSLLIFISLIPFRVQASSNEDLELVDYTISKKNILKGDDFTFGATFRNKSDKDIRDVSINVEEGSFYGKNSTMKLNVAKNISPNQVVSTSDVLELIYNGGNDSMMHLTVMYSIEVDKDRENKPIYATRTQKFYVKVDINNGTPGTETDSKIYEPKLNVDNSSIPQVNAGNTLTLNLGISNVSQYKANDIEIVPELGDAPVEFVDLTSKYMIGSISARDKSNISMKIKARSNADDKVYPITLKFKYKNDYKNQYESTQIIYVKVINNKVSSELSVKNLTSNMSVEAGKNFSFKLELKNEGKEELKDIRVTLHELSGDKIMNNESNYKTISTLAGGKSQTISFSLQASDMLVTGNYPIKTTITYKDNLKNSKSTEQTYYIRVNKNHPNLILSGVKSSKTTVGEGQSFTLTVPVKNTGKATLSNLKVAAIPANDSSVRPTNDYIQYVELKAGETKNLIFTYTLNKGATAGSKSIKISAESGEIKSEYEYSVYADIPEKDDAKANSSRPIIIIDKYIVEPKMVKAGEEFDMNLEFQNTHKSKTVENIKIMIKAIEKEGKESEDVFAPVDGSTTFYIDSISPKSTANISTRMFTIPDAKSKTYKLAVNIEYEYKEGNEIKSATVSDEVGVTVRQNSKFMASDISLPEINQVGMPIYLSLQISNTGKIDLANFTVELEGDFHTDSKKTFIGNVAPGASQSYDVEITPMTAGEQQGALIFSYEEPTGEVVTERREFTIMVEEPYMPPTDEEIPPIDGGMEDPLAQKNSKTKFIIIGAIVLVAVVGGVVVYKKRKKKKAMEEEDIDE